MRHGRASRCLLRARSDHPCSRRRTVDAVFRLLRELPDTDKDRYDVADERGRAQPLVAVVRRLTLGLVVGALGLFLLDPVEGSGRRAQLAGGETLRTTCSERSTAAGAPRAPSTRGKRRVPRAAPPKHESGFRRGVSRRAWRSARTSRLTPRIGCPSPPVPRSTDRGSGRRGWLAAHPPMQAWPVSA